MSADIPFELNRLNPDEFDVHNLADEIRVDQLCVQLLQAVRNRLLSRGYSPLEAGELCRGADYFLRDFAIAECHENPFRLPAERVRQFAGHWYIVRNFEPNVAELATVLAGISACYQILADLSLVGQAQAEAIAATCADLPYYHRRIDEFWAIEDDGYDSWRKGCPLPEPPP